MPSRAIVIPIEPHEKEYLEQELSRLGQLQVQVLRQHQLLRGYTDTLMVQKEMEDRLPLNGNYRIVGDRLLVTSTSDIEVPVPEEIPESEKPQAPVRLNRAQRRAKVKPATPLSTETS